MESPPWVHVPGTAQAGRRSACAGAQVNEAIDYLSSQLRAGGLQGVQCVPASDQSASEAAFRGVPLTSLETRPKVRSGRGCTVLQAAVSMLCANVPQGAAEAQCPCWRDALDCISCRWGKLTLKLGPWKHMAAVTC